MLHAEICQAPCLATDDTEILALCQQRTVSQNQLDVLAQLTRRMSPRACQRMRRRCERDEPDVSDLLPVHIIGKRMHGAVDSEPCSAVCHELGHRTKRFRMHP